ncbi:winged helix-turn-helix transcriptional regulator [Agrobacterium rubi]|uniref:Winged helix-turn-helix transcriptional regulator n=1 Tax=Agrobacterium rubi TaxID=28099 RepID=A0AAE7R5S8_9HYPH|nr:winged helix-turn-helix transcriptional regulator [Agrobacterium rubi]NTF05269.1 winged helix-turn-helix transcriptional regulator [Agrobacterium rubi]NTF37826.1 winged helix-turn-helix transcriptional regulator [Agrobacterium rubi]QTG01694.1 winged helix-turn-helix transcriptional regulator [Agrobacterium rubi]
MIFQIDRAAKATRQRISAHLADSQLTFIDFIVLSAIAEAANIPLGVIADSLDIGPSNFSNMVSLLERRKLVKRKPNGPDKRHRAILVTKRGKAVLQRASSVWIDSEEELTKQLGDTNRRIFVLQALRDLGKRQA